MRKSLGASIAALVVLGLLTLPASGAVSTPDAFRAAGSQVTFPQHGATYIPGKVARMDYVLRDEAPGLYNVGVIRKSGGGRHATVITYESGVTKSFRFPSLTRTGSYVAYVSSGAETETEADDVLVAYSEFTVKEPPAPRPEITRFNLSNDYFFPVKRDGYKDVVRIGWRTRNATSTELTVRNERGRVVTARSSRSRSGVWAWNGRVDGKARTGTFRLTLTARNADGRAVRQTKKVLSYHGRLAGTMTMTRYGTQTSSRSGAGNCGTRSYEGALTLDCWAGRYATANYTFKIPRDAHQFSWRIYGTENCCLRGRIIRTGKRISPTRYRVSLKVTNWRSYTIIGVRFRYHANLMFRHTPR